MNIVNKNPIGRRDMIRVTLAFIVLTALGVWAVKADPLGKVACAAVCVMEVE